MPKTPAAKNITEKIDSSYEQQFTGFHKITSHEGAQWYIYFLLGRIVWAQSSKHSFRKWRRHIAIHSPALSKQIGEPVNLYYEYWNYAALSRLVKLKQFPRTQFSKIAEGYVEEVLFDILQAGEWQYEKFGELLIEAHPKEAVNMPFLMLDNIQPWQKSRQRWHQWKQAGLVAVSPNAAIHIEDSDILKANTPLQTFQTLSSFANGNTTLRDLAVKVKQPLIPIARSIQPYVSKQLLNLAEIEDIIEQGNHGFHLELIENNPLLDNEKTAQVNPNNTKKDADAIETAEESKLKAKSEPVAASLTGSTPQEPAQPSQISVKNKIDQKSVRDNRAKAKPAGQKQLEKNQLGQKSTGQKPSSKNIERKVATPECDAVTNKEPRRKQANISEPVKQKSSQSRPETTTTNSATDKKPIREKIENKSGDKNIPEEKPTENKSIERKPGENRSVKKIPAQKVAAQPQVAATRKSSQKIATTENRKQPALAKPLSRQAPTSGNSKSKNKQTRKSLLPKIIYVDDSPADSRAMAAIVEKMGYSYLNIPDPLQALPMLIELRPKMILLDLVMPIANGYEVCTQLRRVTTLKAIPVIIVTSNSGIIDRVRARMVGASGFLSKPIREEKVIKVLQKHLV